MEEENQLVDVLPDIHELFMIYDQLYFDSKLQKTTVLEWSDKMTRCAGICYLKQSHIIIRLSRKLLQFRPFKDTISTLLHEMIHAFLFLTAPRASYIDRDGHGPMFLQLADRINTHSGANITVYHTFSDEVASLQKHVWRCDGKCRQWPPYFGWVRRAMNRPPQIADPWFHEHQVKCGGSFIKVSGDPVVDGVDVKEKKPKIVAKKSAASTNRENVNKLGGEELRCPICQAPFSNKYKLEFHLEFKCFLIDK